MGECTGGVEQRGDRKGDVRSRSRLLLWRFYYLLPLEMKEHRRQQYFLLFQKHSFNGVKTLLLDDKNIAITSQ